MDKYKKDKVAEEAKAAAEAPVIDAAREAYEITPKPDDSIFKKLQKIDEENETKLVELYNNLFNSIQSDDNFNAVQHALTELKSKLPVTFHGRMAMKARRSQLWIY